MKILPFFLLIFFACSFLKASSKTSVFQQSLTQDSFDDMKPFNPSDGIKIDAFPDTTSFLHDKIFPIDDGGLVEFPMLGKVKITDMTTKELSEFLKSSYKNYLRYPMLVIKPVVRVSLLGGFARPGLYYVDIDKSLWEVVHLAGGPLNEEGIYDMRWERDNDEEADDMTGFFEKGVSLRKMGFKSGDQIWTPSPGAPNIFTYIGNVLPLVTTAITLWYMYYNIQRDQLYRSR